MNKKRSALPNIYKVKKAKVAKSSVDENDPEFFTSTKEALAFVKSLFITEAFEKRIPSIIMKHQLYALTPSRTEVDKDVNDLCASGLIRQFKIGSEEDEIAIVFLDEYVDITMRRNKDIKSLEKFLNEVVKKCPDLNYDKATLHKRYGLTDGDVTELIRCGVLTTRDVGSWWLAIPCMGEFVKAFRKGRKSVSDMLHRTSYHEMLLSELLSRKTPKHAKLGIKYQIYDLIGADIVKMFKTSSGKMLRLEETDD